MKPTPPTKPYKLSYEEKVDKKFIYSYVENSYVENFIDEDDDSCDIDSPNCNVESDFGNILLKDINDVDLAWLISLVPPGVELNQIKISFGTNYNSMAVEGCHLGFYYDFKTPARTKEYNADMKKYNADLEQYKKDLADYENKLKKEKIKQLEEEIQNLKKGMS